MRKILTIITLLATMLVTTATGAVAAYRGDYNGDGIRIRSAPNGTASVLGLGYRGQGVCTTHWVWGPVGTGRTTGTSPPA
ncbi:hypothetical protein ACFQV2_17475 [Actinokineospora soli]|uniref:Uncharacterized protein n=1 Tax=Actinokineospora soli TaxID=1048753 RepID=A0ABW2TMN3_9PSEU